VSLATIRAAIVAKLNTVSGIGVVHDYERYASQAADFRTLYLTGGQILGWHVRRVSVSSKFIAYGEWEETNSWEIRGYAGLNDADASEIAMDNLVEAIRAAFRADDDLGGVVDSCTTPDAAGIQLTSSVPVMFAGVLCHGVLLSLRTVSTATAA